MPITFIITNAGKAAITNFESTGLNPVVISQIGFGSASWAPTSAATALNAEIKKLPASGGGPVAPDTIHVTAQDTTIDFYDVKEVGLFDASGTLIFVYSQATPIIIKTSVSVALFAADIVISGLPAGSITVGDTNFSVPPATETVRGSVFLATIAETKALTEATKAVTPADLGALLSTEAQKGIASIATAAEMVAGENDSKIVTPKKLKDRVLSMLEGFVSLATEQTISGIKKFSNGINIATGKTIRFGEDNENGDRAPTIGRVNYGTDLTGLEYSCGDESNSDSHAFGFRNAISGEFTPAVRVRNDGKVIARNVFDAWVEFNGVTQTIYRSFGISGITVTGGGETTVTLSNAIPEGYGVIIGGQMNTINRATWFAYDYKTSSSVRIVTGVIGGSGQTLRANYDSVTVGIIKNPATI
jgi:hypothetical protein